MIEAWKNGFIQVGIAIGLLGALTLVVWWSMTHQHHFQSYNTVNAPNIMHENKYGEGTFVDSRRDGESLKHESPDHPSHENYYIHQDLKQQTSMAEATEAIVVLTRVSIIIGMCGAFGIFWTLYETRRTATIIRQEQRPWLEIQIDYAEGGITDRDENLVYLNVEWAIKVTNIGKTPAQNVSTSMALVSYADVDLAQEVKSIASRSLIENYDDGLLVVPNSNYLREWIDEATFNKGDYFACPTIIGCTTYSNIYDNDTYQIGFAFSLSSPNSLKQGFVSIPNLLEQDESTSVHFESRPTVGGFAT